MYAREPLSRPGRCRELRGINLRESLRYPANLATFCQKPSVQQGRPWSQTLVRDVSIDGIGLVVDRCFEPETFLEIDLQNTTCKRTSTLFVTVVHAAQQSDGTWLLGCTFLSPLTPEELEALL
jgi:hypothetical protein